MKDKLTLRNVLICCAAFFAVLVFVFSFLTALRVSSGSDWVEYRNIIWGCNGQRNSDGSAEIYAQADRLGAAALPLVGAILTLVGGLAAVVVALVVKDEKIRKIVLFVCGGLLVLGGVFCFFGENGFYGAVAAKSNITVEQAKQLVTMNGNFKVSCGLPIVSGILAILGGGAVVASQFVPDKKLGK